MQNILNKLPVYLRKDAKDIEKIANQFGWKVISVDENVYMVSFKKELNAYDRINVYLTKMTFVTQIKHPKRGKNQLFRRNVWDSEEITKIFENPRVHTNKGYHYRSQIK